MKESRKGITSKERLVDKKDIHVERKREGKTNEIGREVGGQKREERKGEVNREEKTG